MVATGAWLLLDGVTGLVVAVTPVEAVTPGDAAAWLAAVLVAWPPAVLLVDPARPVSPPSRARPPRAAALVLRAMRWRDWRRRAEGP